MARLGSDARTVTRAVSLVRLNVTSSLSSTSDVKSNMSRDLCICFTFLWVYLRNGCYWSIND